MIDRSSGIAIVGVGAMGTALAQGAHAAGRRVVAVASRHPAHAQPLAESLDAVLCDSASEAARIADAVVLCVPDDAIEEVASSLDSVSGKMVAHTAGARDLSILDVAAERGAEAGSLHPVMVVARGGRGHHALVGATAAVDGTTDAAEWLTALATDLGMEPVRIPAEHRALYHLSAALVGGLMTGLLASAVDLWVDLGLDRSDGAQAMGRMVQEAGRNLERLGIPNAVMGPAVRGDTGTLQEHLKVLTTEAPQLVPLYQNLVSLCLPYAVERGALTSDDADALRCSIEEM